MFFELSDVVLLLALISGGLFWWHSHGVKENALRATRNHCKAMDVQLLDESVVLRGVGFQRDVLGHMRLRRSYLFEFTSTGDERYHGCTVMLGRRVETIQLATHRMN
jgi:hypothetical protein